MMTHSMLGLQSLGLDNVRRSKKFATISSKRNRLRLARVSGSSNSLTLARSSRWESSMSQRRTVVGLSK